MARVWSLTSLRRVRAMLEPHAKGEGLRFMAGVVLGIAVVALHVLRPWPLKWVLDYLAGSHGQSTAVHWIATSPIWASTLLCLAFVLIASAEAAAEYGQVMVLNGLGNRVVFRFRAGIFEHLLRQPLRFHESRDVGELLTRVVYDTSRLRRGLNGFLIQVIQTLALFVATLLVLLWHNRTLGLALACGGAVALLAMGRRGRRIAKAAKKQRRKEGSLAALVGEELRGIRELQAFGFSGSAVLARFERRNLRSLEQEQKVRRLAAGLTFRVDAILAVTIALAVGLGIKAVGSGQLTAGDLWLFLSYAMSLRAPFTAFARETARVGRTYACAERLAKIADREPEIVDGLNTIADRLQGEFVFEDVSLKSPKQIRSGRKWTLEQLSCRLPPRKRIAIVGANGAGKSSLLRLALRLADPTSGRVLLDGRDLRDYQIAALRRQVSAVLQDSVLPGLSVRDNIAFGLPDMSMEAIERAARTALAHDFIERLPAGYDTKIRRGGDLLSGGERQLIAIARAVLRDGRIWLLDEPITGLDHVTSERLVDQLLGLTRDRTTLWITHDPQLVTRLDWVLALDRGKTAFSGSLGEYHTWLSSSPTRSIVA
jgi:ATP-binding cassette subfamily B protein